MTKATGGPLDDVRAILVAEDDPDDAYLIERSFRRIGVDLPIRVVEEGGEAKAYLAGAGRYADRAAYPEPALVLTDRRMFRRDGFDLVSHIRADPKWKDLPVVFLTSSTDPADRARALGLGANGYLVKPYTPREFEALLLGVEGYWKAGGRPSVEDGGGEAR